MESVGFFQYQSEHNLVAPFRFISWRGHPSTPLLGLFPLRMSSALRRRSPPRHRPATRTPAPRTLAHTLHASDHQLAPWHTLPHLVACPTQSSSCSRASWLQHAPSFPSLLSCRAPSSPCPSSLRRPRSRCPSRRPLWSRCRRRSLALWLWMAARVRAADRTRGTPPSRHPFDAPACVRSRPRRAVRRLPRHHSRALHPRCLPCHPVSGIMPSAHSRPPARFGPPARLRSTRSLAHASAPHGASHPCANLPMSMCPSRFIQSEAQGTATSFRQPDSIGGARYEDE